MEIELYGEDKWTFESADAYWYPPMDHFVDHDKVEDFSSISIDITTKSKHSERSKPFALTSMDVDESKEVKLEQSTKRKRKTKSSPDHQSGMEFDSKKQSRGKRKRDSSGDTDNHEQEYGLDDKLLDIYVYINHYASLN